MPLTIYISNTIIALSKCKCAIPKEQDENWENLSDKTLQWE
jgi:hypothetical protein